MEPVTHQPQTFASHIAHCRKCGATVKTISFDNKTNTSRLDPCGHAADLVLRTNPRLDV